jgi:hypothetical protein
MYSYGMFLTTLHFADAIPRLESILGQAHEMNGGFLLKFSPGLTWRGNRWRDQETR